MRQPEDFRRDLSRFFLVKRRFPGAHNWNHSHPQKKLVAAPQGRLNLGGARRARPAGAETGSMSSITVPHGLLSLYSSYC